MSTAGVFVPDDRYDRDHASDFESRYGAYLRRNTALFLDSYEDLTRDRLEFAAAAWRIAQAPVMSPPYVLAHPRVLSAEPTWDFDGRLAVAVDIATEIPRELSVALRGRWIGWSRQDNWHVPGTNDRAVAVATAQFRVPMSPDGLPLPSYRPTGEPDTEHAKSAVAVICGRLDSALSGVFARFDRKEAA